MLRTMAGDYTFCGTETMGLLLGGQAARAHAVAAAGADLGFVTASSHERCRVALLVVHIAGLRTWGLPFPRWTYPEAVWMLALGENRYLAIRAHTPWWMVPMLSAFDRYHAHAARVSLAEHEGSGSVEVAAATGDFTAILAPDAPWPAPPVPGAPSAPALPALIDTLWTRARDGRVFRIPWGPDRPTSAATLGCRIVSDRLGPAVFGSELEWDPHAVWFRSRPHRCAPAVREPVPVAR
jgi:hypothetical protein